MNIFVMEKLSFVCVWITGEVKEDATSGKDSHLSKYDNIRRSLNMNFIIKPCQFNCILLKLKKIGEDTRIFRMKFPFLELENAENEDV